MFLALSGQFIESVDLFGPMPTIPRGPHESPDYRRHLWLTRFKLILLRKFFAPQDQVHIPRVVKALRELNQACQFESVETVARYIEEAWNSRNPEDLWKDLQSVLPRIDGKDPLEVLLYGELVHADADKFYALKELDDRDWFILQLISGAQLEQVVRLARLNISGCFDPVTHELHGSNDFPSAYVGSC